MGLDSGIIVKSTHRKITREILPPEIKYPFSNDFNEEVEILYWRKNWGLRNVIVNYLPRYGNSDWEYIIESPHQIFDLIKIIVSFMDKDFWDKEGDSIWEYDEILPRLQQDIINLAIMAAFMKNNPDVYLIYYDSY